MNDEALKAFERADDCVAFVTGIKAKLVAAGWTDQGAELMVLTMINQGAKANDAS